MAFPGAWRRAAAAAAMASTLWLGGCAGAAVGAGAGAAVGVAAYEERGLAQATLDLKIQSLISAKIFDTNADLWSHVGVEVYEGRVLMTGAVPTPELAAEAVKLAWQAEGVRDVLNEIQVAASSALDFAHDAAITTEIRSTITFDKTINAINYKVETVNGVVYLIGIAQNQAELDRVLAHARTVKYVRRIVNHVRLKNVA